MSAIDDLDCGHAISYTTNQSGEDVGSIYGGAWNVQSGAQPNPMVSFDAGDAAYVAEALRLVE